MATVTAVVTCWRRFENLERVIEAVMAEPEVDEVILWDNSENATEATLLFSQACAQQSGLLVIRSSQNLGSSARYALGPLARNELLLFIDDDTLVKPGLVADLLAYWDPDAMMGVRGRRYDKGFHCGPDIEHVAVVTEVDMLLGYVMLVHRKWLMGFDYRKAAWYCCEAELQGRIKAGMHPYYYGDEFRLYVVPTDKYEELPEAEDRHALYLQAGAMKEKEQVYIGYFRGRCLVDRETVDHCSDDR